MRFTDIDPISFLRELEYTNAISALGFIWAANIKKI